MKSLLYGLTVVGSGYLLMAFASHYTQQGLHIATFMLRTIDANRTFIFLVYFLFLTPYFLSSTLAARALGLIGDGTAKTTAKNVAIFTAIAVGGLLVLWVVFVYVLNVHNVILPMFKVNRLYILGIGFFQWSSVLALVTHSMYMSARKQTASGLAYSQRFCSEHGP